MSQFFITTVQDMRTGRESWRVFTLLGTVAFFLSLALKFV